MAHLSSLLKDRAAHDCSGFCLVMQRQPGLQDEEHSQLNALMVQKIRSGAFGHISLFATRLNSVSCLALRTRSQGSEQRL